MHPFLFEATVTSKEKKEKVTDNSAILLTCFILFQNEKHKFCFRNP